MAEQEPETATAEPEAQVDGEPDVPVVAEPEEAAVADETVVTYPLPVPPDPNAPEPQLEECKQQLADARKRISDLEAMVAEARDAAA